MTVLALSVAVAMTSVPVYANELETENVLEVEAEVETEVETEVESEVETAVETEIETEVETEPEIEPESGILDTEGPTFQSITVNKTSVGKGGTIEVTMMAHDEISGLHHAEVHFKNAETGAIMHVMLHLVDANTGKMVGTHDIIDVYSTGTYSASYVYMLDVAGNEYYAYESELPNVSFEVTNETESSDKEVVDISDFSLNSLSFSKSTVTGGEDIKVTATASGDFMHLEISFWASTSAGYKQRFVDLIKVSDGKYEGVISVPYNEYSGHYTVFDMAVYKKNGKARILHEDISEEILAKGYTINNTNPTDTQKPVFHDITFVNTSISVPGSVEVVVDATDDMSGLDYAQIALIHEDGGSNGLGSIVIYCYVNEEGKLCSNSLVEQYKKPGVYKINYFTICDNAGNYLHVPITDALLNKSITITNDAVSDEVITSVHSNTFLTDIKNASANARIAIDTTSGLVIPKEAIAAVKGTNKTLLLNNDMTQWVLKGSDINRAVEFNTRCIYMNGYDSTITPLVGHEHMWQVQVAQKELPGKALLRVLADPIGMKNTGTTGLYVYYYNNSTGELELVAENLSMKNGNNLEFTVTHGGTYVVTKGAALNLPEGPNTWESKSGTEGFVYRLYNIALCRDAEAAGLADWNNKLVTKQQSAAEVARGVIFSPEFVNKNYNDAQFVELMYRTMFGRNGDEGGTAYWLDMLEKGVSREYVFRGFAESAEFSNLCNNFGVVRGSVSLGQYRDQNPNATGFIARLYTQMLGRKFDDGGIEYWAQKYISGEQSIETVASNGFLHSQELINQNLSNEEFVTRMYLTFLDREPDAAGKADWVSRLERGEVTRDTLVYGFTRSQEFGNLKKAYQLP